MARAPTTFSRVSTGYKDSKNTIGEAGYDLSCIDLYVAGTQTGASASSVGGQLTAKGIRSTSNNTFTSNTSIGGGLTVDSGLTSRTGIAVGTGGRLTEISTATAAVSLGAIAPLESSSVVTASFSGVTRGDTIILTLDSLYARAAGNTDVTWCASSGSTTGEVSIWGVNSTLTSVTPTAGTVVRLTRIAHPTYV